jgi:hypothetical protein
MDPAQIREWLDTYGRAWRDANAGALDDLFTPEALYRSHVLRPPHEGHAGIRAYWESATSTQRDVDVHMGEAVVDGEWVAAEWWTTMWDTDEAGHITLPGVLLLHFTGPRCAALWEYWNIADDVHAPFEEWGRVDASAMDAREHARRWASAWKHGWENDDPEEIALLYAGDARFRSHPFREPHEGRAGVLDYVRSALADEESVEARFGDPLASGASAAVEYWATMREGGEDVTLAGCSLLTFAANGAVRAQHDYWHMEPGTHAPPDGWGVR